MSNLLSAVADLFGFDSTSTPPSANPIIDPNDPFCVIKSVRNSDEGINPATGLPMVGGLDTSGNPYGMNMHDSSSFGNDVWIGSSSVFDHESSTSSHDSWSTGGCIGSMFD
jgi:hypothetical protein